MRITAFIPIFALWGCSDDSSKSGSCPKASVKFFEKLVQGIAPDPEEVQESNSALNNASDADKKACGDLIVSNEQAWEFVYGEEGPSKMAAFKRLEGDRKDQAAAELVQALAMKFLLGMNVNSPQFGNNPQQFGNNPHPFGNHQPQQFGNNPLPFGNQQRPQLGNNPNPFGNHQPPQFGNNPNPFGNHQPPQFGNNPHPFGNHQPPQFGNNPHPIGSCPAHLEAILRKVVEEKAIDRQEILGMKSQPGDLEACGKIFLSDDKAWEFVYGKKEGLSKMAEFKSFHGDKKGAAEIEFIFGFLVNVEDILGKARAGVNLRQM